MEDPFHALAILAGAAFFSMVCGASFTFGAMIVCRHFMWAPVNTVINVSAVVSPPEETP
jgi:hypothetical protein